MNKETNIMISSPSKIPKTIVFADIRLKMPKFERGHPERRRLVRLGWVRIGDFRHLSRCISETVEDMEPNLPFLTNRKLRAHNLLIGTNINDLGVTLVDPELTLNGHYALYVWLGSVLVGRRSRDREVASSTPSGALPGNLGQLSLPSLRGR